MTPVSNNTPIANDLPDHWEIVRLKQLIVQTDERVGNESIPQLTLSRHHGVVPKGLSESHAQTNALGKIAHRGDLVLNKMQAWNGILAISGHEGSVSADYATFRFTRPSVAKFLEYVFRTELMASEFFTRSSGIGTAYLRVNIQELLDIKFGIPPERELTKIQGFLDKNTARIDNLIARKTRFIELLAEKRQALITHAVTKGLNPNAKMKDSGVEWLGEVPEHWKVAVLKRLVEFQRGHDLPDEARREGHIPIISSGGRIGFHNEAKAVGPGIVTGRYGSIGLFTLVEEEYWPLNTALYSKDLQGNHARYAWYLLQSVSEHFVLNSMKTAVPGVDRNDIHVVLVAIAPKDEQQGIVDCLDCATARIDTLIAKTERSIELLREHRTALITAAVTGKIDMREAA
jgi:type I restriction enzyme, S subunit